MWRHPELLLFSALSNNRKSDTDPTPILRQRLYSQYKDPLPAERMMRFIKV